MKVAIIGNAGSGKTTVALQLHKLLNIPLFHLDQYCWNPGWQKIDSACFETAHNALCDQDNWIIEGCAARIFEYRAQRADIIIFLDVAPLTCLYRIYLRCWHMLGKVRESSAPGCPDRFPDWVFLRYVMTFNRRRKPIIEQVLNRYFDHKRIFIIKKVADFERCYATLTHSEPVS